MDALFFLFICAVASTLLFYISSIYGQGIDQQISAVYNLEYTGNALVSLQSTNNFLFWNDIRRKVADGSGASEEDVTDYIDNEEVWGEVLNSSPSRYPFLCFEDCEIVDFCYPNFDSDNIYQYDGVDREEDFFSENFTAYTSSVNLGDGCRAIFKVYY